MDAVGDVRGISITAVDETSNGGHARGGEQWHGTTVEGPETTSSTAVEEACDGDGARGGGSKQRIRRRKDSRPPILTRTSSDRLSTSSLIATMNARLAAQEETLARIVSKVDEGPRKGWDKLRKERLLKAVAAVTDEEASKQASVRQHAIVVNLPMVAIHHVAAAFQQGNQDGQAMKALFWMGICVIVILTDVLFLFSLCTTNNWVTCHSQDDCARATVCVMLTDPGEGRNRGIDQHAHCLDCNFLAGAPLGRPVPWEYITVGVPGLLRNQNASEFCANELDVDNNLHLALPQEDFGSCLFAHVTEDQMAIVDQIILIFAFILLSLQLGRDAGEMNACRFARAVMCEWQAPMWRRGSLARTASIFVLWSTDVLFSRAVPAVLPSALLILLMTQGSNSSDIILNGLAVAFVLELDNAIPSALLSEGEIEEVKENVSKAIADYEQARAAGTLEGRAKRRRPLDRIVRSTAAFISLCLGFWRMGSAQSGIPCEMLIYFAYYRVGLTYNVWVPWLMQEVVIAAMTLLGRGERSMQCCTRVKMHAMEWFSGIVWRFTETLLCALVLNVFFFVATAILQWESDVRFALKHYLSGFVGDVFGLCAASGYANNFNLPCLG